ncbi:MAG: glycoside hydrolase family 16 protein [Acidiferrobacterales bacterium]|nr:glycoside hydrolase family 16 protein [Acidiferrobacterales bacterium]
MSVITCHIDDDNVAGSASAPSGYGDFAAYDNTGSQYGATVMIASQEIDGTIDPEACGGGDDWWAASHFILNAAAPPAQTADLTLDGQAFNLTWRDEFDALSYDDWGNSTATWTVPPSNQFGQCAFVGSSGVPSVSDIVTDDGETVLRINANGQDWSSKTCRSLSIQAVSPRSGGDNGMNGYCQMNGYWEVRMKMPADVGTWSAFWLKTIESVQNGKDKHGELDIIEFWGGDNARYYINVHRHGTSAVSRTSPNTVNAPTGTTFPGDYHTFGVWIDGDEMRFYYDRQLQSVVTVDLSGNLAWLQNRCWFPVIDLAVTTSSPLLNEPPADPQYLYVDYVRAYQPRLN